MNKLIVKLDKDDVFELLDYMSLMNEKKDYDENGKPKSHIYLVLKRLMDQAGYVEK